MTYDQNKMAENNNEVNNEQLESVSGGMFFPDYIKDLKEGKALKAAKAQSNGNGGWEGSGGSGSSW